MKDKVAHTLCSIIATKTMSCTSDLFMVDALPRAIPSAEKWKLRQVIISSVIDKASELVVIF